MKCREVCDESNITQEKEKADALVMLEKSNSQNVFDHKNSAHRPPIPPLAIHGLLMPDRIFFRKTKNRVEINKDAV